jgi:hypothetical protein
MMTTESILWRRLESPGHDACSITPFGPGHVIAGTASFLHAGQPAALAYRLVCDAAFHSLHGEFHGAIGSRSVHVEIAHTKQGTWTLNGNSVEGLEGCVDLDFGFTPATNLTQLRRLALAEGQAGDAPSAWLDLDSGELTRLEQRYERRSATTYWYDSPRFGYSALLEARPSGFIVKYPELWEAEPIPG